MQTKELFDTIIKDPNWYTHVKGICKQYASVIVTRHNSDTLAFNTYVRILKAFGYEKNIIWKKNN